MNKFTMATSICLPIRTENIDTDQIIPARFLKTTSREGLGQFLFYNWRFDENGIPKSARFDDSNHSSINILIAGNNFGCGSSREHAVWALMDYGFSVIVSSSFGDIFYNNSLKNGLLPVILSHKELDQLFDIVENNPSINITVDLERQLVICQAELVSVSNGKTKKTLKRVQGDNTTSFHFLIDAFRKTCLLKGVDELGYIQAFENKIKEFEKNHRLFISR